MAELEQRTLDSSNPDEAYSVWAGRGASMQRMAEQADGMVLLTHEAGTPNSAWRLAIPAGTSHAQLTHILAALHDYCAQNGLVTPRAWKMPGEGEAAPTETTTRIPLKGVREGGTRQISIPLSDPDAVAKLQAALSPAAARAKPAQKQLEAPE